MKTRRFFTLTIAVLISFILSITLPSCMATRANKVESKKRGLMLQDKSQYSKNKGHFKPSKSHRR